jgi:hypothetical protein
VASMIGSPVVVARLVAQPTTLRDAGRVGIVLAVMLLAFVGTLVLPSLMELQLGLARTQAHLSGPRLAGVSL